MKPILLVLKNFQSLRERTEIPIGPLTFLYGPNSAGKSCIDDAFAFISAVLHEGASYQKIGAMVKRWRHFNFQPDEPQLGPDSNMLVELHFQTGRFRNVIYSGHAKLQHLIESHDGLFAWFEREKFEFVLAIECDASGVSALTFSTKRNRIFRIDIDPEEDYMGQLTIALTPFGSDFRSIVEDQGVAIEKDADSYQFDCIPSFDMRLRLTALDDESIDWELADVVNTLLLDLAELVSVPINLGSDRPTIPSSSLSTLCGLSAEYFKAPSFSLGLANDPTFEFMRRLAESSFENARAERKSQEASTEAMETELEPASVAQLPEIEASLASQAAPLQLRPSTNEPIHSFVNRCLAEHLFLDQGYQLVFEALEILPATDIQVPPLSAALMIGSLIDKNGRRMTFEDVGTGISCVIPVLVAVHSGNSFIQQPELHLHPALQSAVGDIFVEATKNNHSYHFIETHSEYILLRCLRRVRETTKGMHPEGSPLALRPEDLRVLYFEPQPDGCTKVKNIRVSTQGDFIDRWPRGFFEERSKELFDE